MILDRIKSHIGFTKNADFARFLGIKPNVLTNWYARNTFDIELIYTKCDDINPDWLLTGRGSMLRSGDSGMVIPEAGKRLAAHKKEGVPYWNLPVSAGKSVLDITGAIEPTGYISGLPGADIAENILPVQGASMEPEISAGALIGVRKINNYETLNTERIYLIITHDDRMIKRIEPDPDNADILWCVSPNYPKFKVYKSDIVDIQRVCFVYNPK